MNLQQRSQEYTVGKAVSSINGVQKSGQPHTLKVKLDSYFTPHTKINLKSIQDFKFKFWNHKIPKKKT